MSEPREVGLIHDKVRSFSVLHLRMEWRCWRVAKAKCPEPCARRKLIEDGPFSISKSVPASVHPPFIVCVAKQLLDTQLAMDSRMALGLNVHFRYSDTALHILDDVDTDTDTNTKSARVEQCVSSLPEGDA